MELTCISSVDRISELPCHITQTILSFLPLEDMLRTSVLSRNWRFQWTKVPQLIFCRYSVYSVDTVFGIFIQHQGPIFKFTLCLDDWPQGDIDKIIPYLARNGIQELEIYRYTEAYKVPSSIFSCVELKHLTLSRCIFNPPTFHGFNKLITLKLFSVKMDSYVSISSCPFLESLTMDIMTRIDQLNVDAPKLKVLSFQGSIANIGIINTPLLKVLSFFGDEDDPKGSTFDLMKLLCYLPCLENLSLHFTFLKLLDIGVSLDELPSGISNLRKLELSYVSLNVEDQLSSTLWLLRNSHNLQKFKLEGPISDGPKFELSLKMQEYSGFCLMKLQEVEMVSVCGRLAWPDIEFLKFLLEVSPKLEKLYIGPSSDLDKSDYELVGELVCNRRASRKAEIVFK